MSTPNRRSTDCATTSMATDDAPHTVDTPPDQPEPTFVGSPNPHGRRLEAIANAYFEYVAGPAFVASTVAAVIAIEMYVPASSWLSGLAGVAAGLSPPVIVSIAAVYLYVVADALHYKTADQNGNL